MRILSKLVVGAAVAATSIALAAPAMADPPARVVPRPTDVVAVGSDTIQNLFDQFSGDYNRTHTGRKLYSWDATNPKTGAIHDPIKFGIGWPSRKLSETCCWSPLVRALRRIRRLLGRHQRPMVHEVGKRRRSLNRRWDGFSCGAL